MMTILTSIAASVVLMHCICVASQLSRKEWGGHPLQFIGLSVSYPLIGGGALGAALGWPHAIWILLFGMAGLFLFDRRIAYKKESKL